MNDGKNHSDENHLWFFMPEEIGNEMAKALERKNDIFGTFNYENNGN